MPFWAQIVLISFTAFFTALLAMVIFLYALFFPLLNRLFNLKLPTFDFSSLKKEEPEPVKETGRTQRIFERTQAASAHARYMNLHKDVPTVRLPPTDPKNNEQSLTASKIDAAVRSTKMAGGITEPKNPAPAHAKDIPEKNTPAKNPPKSIASALPKESNKADKQKGNIETIEIPVPFHSAKQEAVKPTPAPVKQETSKPTPAPVKQEMVKPAPVKQEVAKPTQKSAERKKANGKQDSSVATVELPPQTSVSLEKAEAVKSAVRTGGKKPQAQIPAAKSAAAGKKNAETKNEQKT